MIESRMIKKVLVTGSTGFVGRALVDSLRSNHEFDVYCLVRKPPVSSHDIEWDPSRSFIDRHALESVSPDIVVHLAGENILGFWNDDKKRRILESRTKGTKLLCETLASLPSPPSIFISASGCSYYGTQVSLPVDENIGKGKGYFSDVVEKWEASTEPLQGRSRISFLRFGIVFDPSGGFFSKIYYPFYFGLGGVVGSGDQWFPWVSLTDSLNAIYFIISNDSLSGPFNIVSPNPVTNFTFTKTLGRVLNRPTICWVPEFVLCLVLGKEMAYETALSSQRVIPARLIENGFKFTDNELESTLIKQLTQPQRLTN